MSMLMNTRARDSSLAFLWRLPATGEMSSKSRQVDMLLHRRGKIHAHGDR